MQPTIRDIFRAVITALFPAGGSSARVRRRGYGAVRERIDPKLERGHISLLPYRTEAVRDFIRAIKYEHDTESIAVAADILREFLHEEHLERGAIEKTAYLLCTIPGSAARRQKEGYNHMHRILDRMHAAGMFAEDDRSILMWVRPVRRQSGIRNRGDRMKNVRHMLRARHPVPENTVCIVIDDVVTTGATLSEARRALTEAGAHAVLSVALAR